jgi:hypothetical protein
MLLRLSRVSERFRPEIEVRSEPLRIRKPYPKETQQQSEGRLSSGKLKLSSLNRERARSLSSDIRLLALGCLKSLSDYWPSDA